MDSEEKKAALKESVKKLHVVISAEEKEHGKKIIIQILSDLQLQAAQTPSGFNPERLAEYVASNPTGGASKTARTAQDKTPGKPQPHLQKALARSILYAHENWNNMDILPYIAGKEDMRRMVGKS